MQAKRTIDPVYYGADDVSRILRYSKATAYKIIRQLNKELSDKGYMIRPGLINKSYFDRRFMEA